MQSSNSTCFNNLSTINKKYSTPKKSKSKSGKSKSKSKFSKSQVNSPRVSEFNISQKSKNSNNNKKNSKNCLNSQSPPLENFKQGLDLINLNDILGIKPINQQEQKIKKKIKNLGGDITVTFKENIEPENPEMYFPYKSKNIEIQDGKIIQKEHDNFLGKREKIFHENRIGIAKKNDNFLMNNIKPKSYINSTKKNGFNWNSDKCVNAAIFDWDRDCLSEGNWDCLEIDSD